METNTEKKGAEHWKTLNENFRFFMEIFYRKTKKRKPTLKKRKPTLKKRKPTLKKRKLTLKNTEKLFIKFVYIQLCPDLCNTTRFPKYRVATSDIPWQAILSKKRYGKKYGKRYGHGDKFGPPIVWVILKMIYIYLYLLNIRECGSEKFLT